MPTSYSHIDLCLITFPLPLLHSLQNQYCYFCHCYRYYHITLLLNTLLQILSFLGVVELTTQLLILEIILWLPLCRINKFGLNTLPSKTVVIPYTCGLSPDRIETDSSHQAEKILKDLKPLELLTSSRCIMTVSFRLSLLRCLSRRTGTQSQ